MGNVTDSFVGACQVHPVICGERIFLDCFLEGFHGLAGIAGDKIQLLETAQSVPGCRVSGL